LRVGLPGRKKKKYKREEGSADQLRGTSSCGQDRNGEAPEYRFRARIQTPLSEGIRLDWFQLLGGGAAGAIVRSKTENVKMKDFATLRELCIRLTRIQGTQQLRFTIPDHA
jgi:hypothetical protein